MKVMGYVNKFNRGIDRVQSMLQENGNPQAQFDVNKLTVFEVTIGESKDENLTSGSKSGSKSDDLQNRLISFCKTPKSLAEIAEFLNYKDRHKLKKNYIDPLPGATLQMTIPDKPTSRFQQYVAMNNQ